MFVSPDIIGAAPALSGGRHRLVAAALTAAVLLSICGAPRAALAAAAEPGPPAPPGVPDVPPPCGPLASASPIPLPATSVPAGPVLRRLAAHLGAEPADTQHGRYTQIRVKIAAADSSIGDCTTTVLARVVEERVRDEDRSSGRITGTPWYADPDQPAPLVTTWYRAGELTGVLPGRVPTNPGRLGPALDEAVPPDTDALVAGTLTPGTIAFADRLDAYLAQAGFGAEAGTASRVDAVGRLIGWHHTNKAARQAILTVLADVPELRSHGRVTVDGVAGIAVSIPNRQHTSRLVLIIDAHSGQVRASEEVLTDPVIGRNLAVRVPFPFSSTRTAPQARVATPASRQPALATALAG